MSSPQINGDVTASSFVLTGAVQVPPDFYTTLGIDIYAANYLQPLPLPFSLLQGFVPSDLGQRDFKLEVQILPLPTSRTPNPSPQWVTLASGITNDPKWKFWNQFAYDSPFGCSTLPLQPPCQGITYAAGTGCLAPVLNYTGTPLNLPVSPSTRLHVDLSSLAYALSEQIRTRGALYARFTLPTYSESVTYSAGSYSVTAGASPKWHVEVTFAFGNALPNTTSPNAFVTSYGKFDTDKWVWSSLNSGVPWSQIYNNPQQVAIRNGINLCGPLPNWAADLHSTLLDPDTSGDCVQSIDFPQGAVAPNGPYLDPSHTYPYRAQLIINTRSRGWEQCIPWCSDYETGGCSADSPEGCCGQTPFYNYQYGRTGQNRARSINFSLDGNPLGGAVFTASADNDIPTLDGIANQLTGQRTVIDVSQSLLPLLVGSGHQLSFTTDVSFHLMNSGEMYFALQTAGATQQIVNVEFHAQSLVNNIKSPITQNIDLDVLGQAAILNGTTGTASMPCTIAPQYNNLTDTTGQQWSFNQWQIYNRPTIGTTPVLLNTYSQPEVILSYNQDITVYAIYTPSTPLPIWAIGAGIGGIALLGAALAFGGRGKGKAKSVAR